MEKTLFLLIPDIFDQLKCILCLVTQHRRGGGSAGRRESVLRSLSARWLRLICNLLNASCAIAANLDFGHLYSKVFAKQRFRPLSLIPISFRICSGVRKMAKVELISRRHIEQLQIV